MSGMTDGQRLRNAQWGKISRLFKPAMVIGAAPTASAETLYRTVRGIAIRVIYRGGRADPAQSGHLPTCERERAIVAERAAKCAYRSAC